MRYFTAEELRKNQKEGAKKLLGTLSGKNVKYGWAINVFKELSKKFGWSKDIRILDLGITTGEFTNQLFDNGYKNLYGVDLDEYLPPESRTNLKEFKTADLNKDQLPWPDKTFDVATSWCVLPHLENPFHAGREVARVLRPGGFFIFTALHLTSKASMDYFNKNKFFGSYRETNNHISMLPPGIVKKTFQQFELVGVDYLIIPKIFRGFRGKIKKWLYDFSEKYPRLRNYLKERWGYNIAYILKRI
jgi:SAM-dependent methyltransferase